MSRRLLKKTGSYRLLPLCLLLCGVYLGLTACGFQLRGTGGGAALPAEWRSMYPGAYTHLTLPPSLRVWPCMLDTLRWTAQYR